MSRERRTTCCLLNNDVRRWSAPARCYTAARMSPSPTRTPVGATAWEQPPEAARRHRGLGQPPTMGSAPSPDSDRRRGSPRRLRAANRESYGLRSHSRHDPRNPEARRSQTRFILRWSPRPRSKSPSARRRSNLLDCHEAARRHSQHREAATTPMKNDLKVFHSCRYNVAPKPRASATRSADNGRVGFRRGLYGRWRLALWDWALARKTS